MGTWDIGFFDNDMACDWENDLKHNQNLSYIEEALKPVILNTEDSLDIDEANRALAAAESLSKLLGNGSDKTSYTKHIDKWAKDFNEVVPESLKTLAINSLDKILSIDSEVRQYWTLRGEFLNWEESIKKLKERLLKSNEK